MGKKTSDIFARFRVSVQYCNDTIDPGCVNSSYFNNLASSVTQFSIAMPFINTKINPGQENYKSVYLEDRNYCPFTTTFGASIYVPL